MQNKTTEIATIRQASQGCLLFLPELQICNSAHMAQNLYYNRNVQWIRMLHLQVVLWDDNNFAFRYCHIFNVHFANYVACR